MKKKKKSQEPEQHIEIQENVENTESTQVMEPEKEADSNIIVEPDEIQPRETVENSENNESDNYREDCHPQENSEKDKEIKSIIESLLFSANEPLSVTKIYFLLKEDFSVNKKYISTTIDFLKNEYDANMRGFEISEVSDGFILKTRKTYHIWIKKLHKERAHDALSKTALETLSIIAYKQPISRGEIEKIRGVNVDGAMKILLEKALICASGRKEVPGKPWLYSTTKNFLMAFGLKNLQELPPLGELSLN